MRKPLVVAVLLGLIVVAWLGDDPPPPLEALQPVQAKLLEPATLVKDYGKGRPGAYALLRTDHGTARISRLCFLAGCELTPELAQLKAGDLLTLWTDRQEAFQVTLQSGSPVLPYPILRSAYVTQRNWRIVFSLVLAALAAAVFLIRSKPRPA